MPKDAEIEFQNEKEWRRYQIKRLDALESKFDHKMDGLEKRMTALEVLGATMKVTVSMVSAFISVVSSAAVSFFTAKH